MAAVVENACCERSGFAGDEDSETLNLCQQARDAPLAADSERSPLLRRFVKWMAASSVLLGCLATQPDMFRRRRSAESSAVATLMNATGVAFLAEDAVHGRQVYDRKAGDYPSDPTAEAAEEKAAEEYREIYRFYYSANSRYPQPYKVDKDHGCGSNCPLEDLCCPAPEGYGGTCGKRPNICCQGDKGSTFCKTGLQCCATWEGEPFCCEDGEDCQNSQCVKAKGECFPGDAVVTVRDSIDGTSTADSIANLQVGDVVLAGSADGVLRFESVLGFLHEETSAPSSHLVVQHAVGKFRVSFNHLVYTLRHGDGEAPQDKAAIELRIGDSIFVPLGEAGQEGAMATSKVLALQHVEGSMAGMYAPLTASGHIIVDGVLASTFATSANSRIPHAAQQAVFFTVRAAVLLMGLFNLRSPAVADALWPAPLFVASGQLGSSVTSASKGLSR
eukprot:TRINITY_DN15783_c0_g1_i1.p1 TRINITY_DN15783_c0_g1~~TRINITY_DN15783_c0_g1_i1.p1  ORF type:complete len:472 (-),score=90.74 TRINITY_DN15783_c0_g1_i1:345-1682(-)